MNGGTPKWMFRMEHPIKLDGWCTPIYENPQIRHWNSWTFRRVPSCFSSGAWSSGRFLLFFGNLELLDMGFAQFQAVACPVTFLLGVSVRTSREGFLDGVHMHLHVDLDDSNCVSEVNRGS